MTEGVKVRECVVRYAGRAITMPAKIIDPESARRWLAHALDVQEPRERLVVLALDNGNRPLGWQTVSIGTAAETAVPTSEILRFVLVVGGSAFILAHNHPSGDASPSESDARATRALTTAATLVGLRFVDHIIVASGAPGTGPAVVSLRAQGLL